MILGTGYFDSVRLSSEAADYFDKMGCMVVARPTPEAITAFNQSKARKIGLFHVTC